MYRLEAGSLQRRSAGHPFAFEFGLAFADDHRCHVGEWRKIARSTDGSLRRHDRSYSAFQHLFDKFDEFPSNARCPSAQRQELEDHHQSYDAVGDCRPDAAAVGEYEIALQRRGVARRDLHACQLAEASIHAIDRFVAAGRRSDHGRSGVNRRTAGRIDRHVRLAPVDGFKLLQRHIAGLQDDGTHDRSPTMRLASGL